MVFDKATKEQIVKKFARGDNDTGAPEVQIALSSERIKYLTEHMKINRKDFSSKRGLLQLLAHRRGMLNYLKKEDEQRYKNVVQMLGLKR
jgi:small subunit ribosomal protein S15